MANSFDEKKGSEGCASMEAVNQVEPESLEIDPAVEKRVLRKLDCTVLIMFAIVSRPAKFSLRPKLAC